jgi:hypothetical protein
MKPLSPSQFRLAAAACLLLILPSCVLVPGSWKNENIKSGKREDFHKLNTEALAYLKANNPKGLNALLSKEMIAANNERQVELISNRLTDNPYELADEFYVVNKYSDNDTVLVKGGDVKRYGLVYPYSTIEMYFAYFLPKKSDNAYMISLVYGKFNYGWKIIKLDLEPYSINGKTAPELYALAKDQYEKKELQAALNNVTLAITCFKPGAYWQYPDQADAARFYAKVRDEVNEKYSYPIVLRQLATGPMILRVYTQRNDEGTFPLVYYMTHFNLKDTIEVKKENLQIRKVVDKLIPGLHDNNKYVLYSAFNVQPNGYKTVDHFDMMDKQN